MAFVDVELVKEGPGRYLRIYIDKDGGVSLSDCEAYHRAVQPQLERVEYDFLEVSSPGLDRPLSADGDFARAMDTEVEVRLFRAVDKRKIYEGFLRRYAANTLTIEAADGEKTFDRRDVALVKPIIRFEDDGGED